MPLLRLRQLGRAADLVELALAEARRLGDVLPLGTPAGPLVERITAYVREAEALLAASA